MQKKQRKVTEEGSGNPRQDGSVVQSPGQLDFANIHSDHRDHPQKELTFPTSGSSSLKCDQ